MSLFQTHVLNNSLKQQDSAAIDKTYKRFTAYFHDPVIQDNIRQIKEEEYQGIFLTELFVKVLDYTMRYVAGYNLLAEYKNEKNPCSHSGRIIRFWMKP